MCTKHGQWIAQILGNLELPKYMGKNAARVQMLGDNQGSVALTEKAHLERSKHIDISHHFIRDLGGKGRLIVDHIPTDDMIADGMTKALARVKFP